MVRLPDGALSVGRHLPGRGAWLCAGSPRCAERALAGRALEQALRAPVDPAARAALRAALGERA